MDDQPPPEVLAEAEGPVTILTLNRPDRRNALSIPLRTALIAGLETALRDPGCRAIVVTGAGGHFCAGGDIGSMEGVTALAGRERMALVQRLVRLLVEGEKPVIAAVEGHAIGAGLSLAACCDIVVAAAGARFTCSFNRIGLVPDLGATWALPLRMGLGRAKLAILTGRTLDADAAERAGLADLTVEAGGARGAAIALGHELTRKAPLSNGFAKGLLSRVPASLDDMLRTEADAQAVLFTTADCQEGRTAFLARREPVFTGR